jgi:diguanylate cyclase (GGDEF)-like protein
MGKEMGDPHEIACSLTSTLLRRVRRSGGDAAVTEVLLAAGTTRSAGYLEDVSHWVSYEEALALFAAAVEVTGDPTLPVHAGEDTVRQHAGTPVATLLRSMGSPEQILEQIAVTASKFSMVTLLEPVQVEPGRCVVSARARPGYQRQRHLCEWTRGMLSQPTALFGLPPAVVTETECQVRGDAQCLYEICWDAEQAAGATDPKEQVSLLEGQLAAMTERVENVLATTAELIADDDLDSALARITERAATMVRAPRYLLAVRPTPGAEVHCHHRGLSEDEADALVVQLLDAAAPTPHGCLVAHVRSPLQDYGVLVAISDTPSGFFAQESELFSVYARYAATVLDRATALVDVQSSRDEARALLELSRALAASGGSDEVAQRLIAAIPQVVDCDRAGFFLWDPVSHDLRAPAGTDDRLLDLRVRPEDTPALRELLEHPDTPPLYFDRSSDDPFIQGVLETYGDEAFLAIPVAARGTLLGVLAVAVVEQPERLQMTPQLLDRLTGVVAQAATAIQSGKLIDQITHQALHDGLTGLANRELFGRRLAEATARADSTDDCVALFYVDVDRFKAVNDAYGHGAGDELLGQVADRLMASVRAGDTVARLGGDEFAVLLSNAPSDEQVEAVGQRIVQAFASPFSIDGVSTVINASIGRALWPGDFAEPAELLRAADASMYEAKRDRAATSLLDRR